MGQKVGSQISERPATVRVWAAGPFPSLFVEAEGPGTFHGIARVA